MRKFKGFRMGVLAAMGAGLLGAGASQALAFAADPVSIDPDGPGGIDSTKTVFRLDYVPGNLVAVNGNAAVAAFNSTATFNPSTGRFEGGTQVPIQVYYQASLAQFANSVGN